jgi:hypothetical protein
MKQVDWMSEIKTTKHSVVTTVNNMNSWDLMLSQQWVHSLQGSDTM